LTLISKATMKKSDPSILSIGSDIIEIKRIRSCLEMHGERFLNRVFTPKEQEYCLKHKDPAPRLAARFAAKEAASKALGTGIGEQLSWKEIEIINQPSGKPELFLSPQAQKKFNAPSLIVTLSHCVLYAQAVVLRLS
jgi:holo-[acyl-carrier protein] synthase